MIRNFFGHLHTVNKHRFKVFILCCKCGIPFRGLVHDLSKYSPTEFLESVKYYTGEKSPIVLARKDLGYSKAWLHHKGRNKHHFEYWVDLNRNECFPVFPPYKYLVEAMCDKVAAGMVYRGKKWSPTEPLDYWLNIEKNNPVLKHPATIEFTEKILTKIANDGVNEGLKPKFLKETYDLVEKKYFKN